MNSALKKKENRYHCLFEMVPYNLKEDVLIAMFFFQIPTYTLSHIMSL